jgi:hypothetical protein
MTSKKLSLKPAGSAGLDTATYRLMMGGKRCPDHPPAVPRRSTLARQYSMDALKFSLPRKHELLRTMGSIGHDFQALRKFYKFSPFGQHRHHP